MKRDLSTILALFLILIGSVHAQDGVVDPTFADNAVYAFINPNEGMNEYITKVAVAANGKIVLAGTASDGVNNELLVARLMPDGTPDASFGTNGISQFNFSPTNSEELTGLTLQGNNIVICGTSTNQGSADFFVMRLNNAGVVDLTFGNLGVTVIDIGNGTQDHALVIRQDRLGNLVIAGSSEDTNGPNGRDLAVVRLTANGALDNTFSSDGVFTWAITNGYDAVKDVVFNAANDAFLVGEAVSAGQRRVMVGALNSAGAKILSYGGGGTARVLHPLVAGFDAYVYRALFLENGGIFLVGSGAENFIVGFMMRLDANGALDATFDDDGVGYLGTESDLSDVVKVEDGYLICGSLPADDNTTANTMVIRLGENAVVVPTFANGGVLEEDVLLLNSDIAYGIAMQSYNAAIIVGLADGGANGVAGFAYRISVEQTDPTVGIAGSMLQNIAIHPNPAIGTLTIASPVDPGSNVVIMDARGAVVFAGVLSPTRQLDVSGLAAGVYTITIGTEQQARFVKQ